MRFTSDLLEAAMAVCDHYSDGPEQRTEMREQCLAVSLHLQQDLLEHLTWVARADASNS